MNKFECIDREQRTFPEFKFNGRQLKEKESKMLLSLMLSTDNEKSLKDDEELANEFASKIILKRINAYDLKFEISNFFLIMSIVTFATSPGNLMILLRLCYQYWKKTNKSLLNVADWANIFPMGVPTNEELIQMWDSQKHQNEPLSNMVDNVVYWK